MGIVHKTYEEIDKAQWDKCIDRSVNGLLYAKSFYLDVMSPGWQALVLDDYAAVMPLTPGKKWGIPYLYQAPFVPQGGIFSEHLLTDIQIKVFIDAVLRNFKFIEIPLNHYNMLPADSTWDIKHRSNYILDLREEYETIYNTYPSSTKKNLNRLKKFGLQYRQGSNHKNIVSLYYNAYGTRMKPYIKEDFERLVVLFDSLQQSNQLLIREVFYEDSLLAAAVFPFDGKRIYNLISYVSDEGRDKEANYFMFDNIIKEFAGQPLVLDFEGSDVAGIASFYRQFSKTDETYPFIRINRLPLLAKLVKSIKDKIS